ncbi:hypothetical protein SAMN05444354_11813 [Stigmatella aurantiaca]|uniref:Uncharacterized protein n=1 Tax=Stigmatella aurantiaca TaxID=41 RepID=A0A1H7Z0Z8_STIAU|nr:hypothetical protein [Stigmatella aurantiaca]SEM51674.1 hypothetical protein SAMN05444354_11813 [Stigmatella aurantiaca]
MRVSRRELVAASLVLACAPRSGHPVRPDARGDERASAYPDFVKAYIPALIPYLDDDLGLREQTAPGQLTAWLQDRNWERFSKAVLSIRDGRISMTCRSSVRLRPPASPFSG